MNAPDIVRAYWADMGSNDFARAARWLAQDFVLYWPQSQEIIRGRANFAALNAAYPASGRWRFAIAHLTGDGDTAASDVEVTDGTVVARAITFHWIRGGLIAKQVEYWPDAFEAPEWRRRWVERGAPPG
jgi:hypothetical protein